MAQKIYSDEEIKEIWKASYKAYQNTPAGGLSVVRMNARAEASNVNLDDLTAEQMSPPTLDVQLKNMAEVPTQIPNDVGIFGTNVLEVTKNFRPSKNQKVFQKNDSFIVLGRDRTAGIVDGFGGKGAQKASSIDLVVGRMASSRKGKGPKSGEVVDSHFGADAARIYISQLTKIDDAFAIVPGREGIAEPRSAIGIKADYLRLVGREGIKIVTGKSPYEGFGRNGEPNSRGGTIHRPAPKIELLAGNNDGDYEVIGGEFGPLRETISNLQPLIRGDNMVDAMKELCAMLEEVISAVFTLALVQTAFNSTVSVNPLPWYPGAGSMSVPQILDKTINSIWHTRINANLWELNYTDVYGYKYICSRNVHTT